MNAFTAALIPIAILIFLGYVLKRKRFLSEEVWSGLEKLTYFILFPSLLIYTLARQSIAGVPWDSIFFVVSGAILSAAAVLVLIPPIRHSVDGATFTSIFQGGVRFNTYIALAVSQGMFGSQGLAYASLAAGFMIVLMNLLCITAFALWGNSKISGVAAFIQSVFANPLIIACAIGWVLSLSGFGLPGVTDDIFEILGRAALPFGLLAVGAALKPAAMIGHLGPISISSLVQFGLKPLVAALLISLTGLEGVLAGVLIIMFMVPTAPSAYILARQLGGEIQTMASIITFQTIIAFALMPIIAIFLL